jgi:valyl-tRNA synthetase
MNEGNEEPMSVTELVDDMEVLIPMAGFIDKEKEKAAGVARDITKLKDQIEKIKVL